MLSRFTSLVSVPRGASNFLSQATRNYNKSIAFPYSCLTRSHYPLVGQTYSNNASIGNLFLNSHISSISKSYQFPVNRMRVNKSMLPLNLSSAIRMTSTMRKRKIMINKHRRRKRRKKMRFNTKASRS